MINEVIIAFVILLLFAILVFQQQYWSSINKDLLDRLMAKNNAEYQQVKNFEKISTKKDDMEKKLELQIQAENDRVLAELNGQLGL